jgi:hypothetical protein
MNNKKIEIGESSNKINEKTVLTRKKAPGSEGEPPTAWIGRFLERRESR